MWGAASPVAEGESPSGDSGEGAESNWVTLQVEFDHEEQAWVVILVSGRGWM